MALQVDPGELAAAAAALAELARGTGASMPTGWVLPAGSDPISAQAVPQLNTHAANVMNGMAGILHQVHRTAHKIGEAAQRYTDADDEGARAIGGPGGEVLPNPVSDVDPPTPRRPPGFGLPASGGAVDPLTFAQQLRAGPGTGPASRFVSDVRNYLGTTHAAALAGVDTAAMAMQHWTPVGSDAAAKLNGHRNWLDTLGSTLGTLADGIDTYTKAFDTAKAKHPTPEEIIAARKELVRSMRSKNELGIQAALAKFQEQNARSAETIGNYYSTVGVSQAENAGDSETGTAASASGQSNGSGDSSQMMSTLASMLPTVMSGLMAAGMPMMGMNGNNETGIGSPDDYGYGDYGYDTGGGDYGYSGGGAGGDVTPIGDLTSAIGSASSTPVAVGPMPTVASSTGTVSSVSSNLPRTPVIESLQNSAGTAARAAGTGSPMMPYMPMSPGMGGGGANNERNRVVAWHPDRLMYVDDTPHTDAVIGEKPTIAPTVTPATPGPANQAPTQTGGSA
ncbi:PE domain-containing protein [Nocardia nova]|uniref:PE domain-containing protein n=3 Tax=Nocardia nova TaxID=37330 RepID=UPI001894C0ED|nr:PPE domain-containing protein [Nocardia nova]MBF6149168.1 PPE domain-containing protein [Nocardia nova]